MDSDCNEDKVEISGDYVQDRKSIAKKCPLICLDNDITNNVEFLNKNLAFYLDNFCAKAVVKYINCLSKRSHYNIQPK